MFNPGCKVRVDGQLGNVITRRDDGRYIVAIDGKWKAYPPTMITRAESFKLWKWLNESVKAVIEVEPCQSGFSGCLYLELSGDRHNTGLTHVDKDAQCVVNYLKTATQLED